eukprot:1299955-Prorocentrum_lima.AAC.1
MTLFFDVSLLLAAHGLPVFAAGNNDPHRHVPCTAGNDGPHRQVLPDDLSGRLRWHGSSRRPLGNTVTDGDPPG